MNVVIGCVGGMILFFGVVVALGADMAMFMDPVSFTLILGGSAFSATVAFPTDILKSAGKYFMKAVKMPAFDYKDLIHTLTTFSETARKEGLLTLEDKIKEISDPFLKKGIQLAIDGIEEETIRSALEQDLDSMEKRHHTGKNFFDQMNNWAPSWGLVGTLLGLVIMLENIENKSALGHGAAIALLATMYGSLFSYLIFGPLAVKLEVAHDREVLSRKMMMEGVLSLVHGENVRLLKDKLVSFLPREMRAEFEEVGE